MFNIGSLDLGQAAWSGSQAARNGVCPGSAIFHMGVGVGGVSSQGFCGSPFSYLTNGGY